MRVYGLSENQKQELAHIAKNKLGKPSVSALAKYLLLNELQQPIQNQSLSSLLQSRRIQIRVAQDIFQCLKAIADKEHMSVNQYILMLLQELKNKEPLLTTNEVNAVRESNYQLYKIGVNLNQIAKALNNVGVGAFELDQINQLKHQMDLHIRTVHKLIDKNKERI